MTIDALLKARKVIIVSGTGGVGKTTLSAALAMRAALLGKRAVVVTIDPAKRLSTSLGVEKLSDDPTDLTLRLKKAVESQKLSKAYPNIGSFYAIVPDTKNTFEKFVRYLAPNPGTAEQLMKNPIFQIFAKEFSGANEYMALERLHSLNQNPNYDIIILDTPPSRNTLEFLDAPHLLARLFDERLIKWIALPANQLVSAGMRKALGLLEKLTGSGFMSQLFEFGQALFEVRLKFAAKLKEVTALLESPKVGFLLVTRPSLDSSKDVEQFIESLHSKNFGFDGMIINRMLSEIQNTETLPKEARARELLQAIVKQERKSLESMQTARTLNLYFEKLPELSRDVHSLEDLLYVAFALDVHHHGSNSPG